MNKKSLLYALAGLIGLGIFNAIFFMVGGAEHPASVWISYGFIHFAYIMLLLTPVLAGKSRAAMVFGMAIDTVSSVYFVVEFVVGLLFILIGLKSYTFPLLAQLVIFGVYAVALIMTLVTNVDTAEKLQRQEAETAYLKGASGRIKLLLDKTSDKAANREIEKAYDALHAAPSRSNQEVQMLESTILVRVTDLERAVSANDIDDVKALAGEIVSMTAQRNQQLSLSN